MVAKHGKSYAQNLINYVGLLIRGFLFDGLFYNGIFFLNQQDLHIDPDCSSLGPTWGPTWFLSAPDGPHAGSTNLAIRGSLKELGNPFPRWTDLESHLSLGTWCQRCHHPVVGALPVAVGAAAPVRSGSHWLATHGLIDLEDWWWHYNENRWCIISGFVMISMRIPQIQYAISYDAWKKLYFFIKLKAPFRLIYLTENVLYMWTDAFYVTKSMNWSYMWATDFLLLNLCKQMHFRELRLAFISSFRGRKCQQVSFTSGND